MVIGNSAPFRIRGLSDPPQMFSMAIFIFIYSYVKTGLSVRNRYVGDARVHEYINFCYFISNHAEAGLDDTNHNLLRKYNIMFLVA